MTERASALRQRMIEDMTIRNMSPNTQTAYGRAAENSIMCVAKTTHQNESSD